MSVDLSPDPPAAEPPVRLWGWQALAALVVYLGGQVGCGFSLLVAAALLAALTGSGHGSEVLARILPPVVLIALLVGAALLVLAVRLFLGPSYRKAGPGLGFVRPRLASVAGGTALGLALGVLALTAIRWPGADPTEASSGLLARMAEDSTSGLVAFLFVALACASAVEEFLFRGVLLQGFSARLGTAGAVVLSTVLFVALHLPDTWGFWPATVIIALLGLAAAALRLASGSLLPPTLCHLAYNGVVVAFLWLGVVNPFLPPGEKARLYLDRDQYEQAVESYSRALEAEPESGEFHALRGYALDELGRRDEALADYDLAVKLEPGSAMAHNNRGYLLAEMGRYEEALAECDRSLELNPRNPSARDSRAYTLVGLGRYEEALEEYDRALEEEPDSAHAHFGRGTALRHLGREREAEDAIRRARELAPGLDLRWVEPRDR